MSTEDPQMKVLFLVRSLNVGGAERQLVALARGLHARGISVEVAVFYPGGPLEQDLRAAGIPIRDLGKRHRWDLLGFFRGLLSWVRTHQPAVLHGYLVVPNIFCALIKPFVPGLKVVWGVRAAHVDFGKYDWTARASFTLSAWLARFADLIIVNSFAGRSFHLAHGYPAAHMLVVPNGIDTEKFRIDPQARTRLRAQWAIDPGHPLVGCVARLDPMKDHVTFLQAVARILSARPGVRFVCIGDGPAAYRESLQEQARQLGIGDQIVWAGGVRDMAAAYNALDVNVLASRGEGFPNTLGEAQACGVPCVATDVGDVSRIIEDVARVVPIRDPAALAAAIDRELDRPRAPRDPGLRARIQDLYSLEAMVNATLGALATLQAAA